MTLEHIQWAISQDIKNAEFKVLVQLANHCDHNGIYAGGQDRIMACTGYKDRGLRDAINKLRSLGLIHTERQKSSFAVGRAPDLIILHPENREHILPGYIQTPEEIELFRRSRELNETFEEDYVSPSQTLPAKNAGKANEPVDNFSQTNVSPSQTLPAKNAGKGDSTGSFTLSTGKSLLSTGTTAPVDNTKTPVNISGALKGNARATRALKGNLLTDINQSISPSVNTSTGAREFSRIDGRIDKSSSKNSFTVESELIGHLPATVAVSQLRAALYRQRISTQHVNNQTLGSIIELVTDRYTSKGEEVKNPVGLTLRAIQNEDGGLLALIAQVEAKARYQALQEQEQESEIQAVRMIECPVHTNVQHRIDKECPSCLGDRKASQSELSAPVNSAEGVAFRERIRARRTSLQNAN